MKKSTLPATFNLEKQLVSTLSVSLNYIENAYEQLNYFVKNEDKLNDVEREKFYSYGRENLMLNLVRLVNIKKSLMAILGNKRVSMEMA